MKRTLLFLVLLSLLSLFSAGAAQAQLDFQISLDTTGLPAQPAGTYYLDFALNGTQGSQANITSLMFGGGALTGSPILGGAASTGAGNPPSFILLGPTSMTNFSNSFDQTFTPGSIVQFNLHITPAPGSGDASPDQFVFGLTDTSATNPVVSSDSEDNHVFATVDIPANKSSFTPGNFSTYSYTVNGITYTTQVKSLSSAPAPNGFVSLLVFASTPLLVAGWRRWQERRGAAAPTEN